MDSCSVCGHARDDHPYRHPFTEEGQQLGAGFMDKKPEPPRQAPVQVMGGVDPILRRALIGAGVITEEQLREAAHHYIAENGATAGVPPKQ